MICYNDDNTKNKKVLVVEERDNMIKNKLKQTNVVFTCIVALVAVNILSFVLIYRETNEFLSSLPRQNEATTYQQRIEQLSLLGGPTKDETVNITAETAGSVLGADQRVSLSGNIYYSTLANGERSNKWAVVIHGFMMTGDLMANAVGQMYLDQGYNVLAPDLRGAGSSKGKTGMGYSESLDIWDWLTFLNTNYSVDEVIVHGISLGGATTLQLWSQKDQGRDLASQKVVGLVDDCGYTSMTGIIDGLLTLPDGIQELGELLNLPELPSLYDLIGYDNVKKFLISFVGVGLNEGNFDYYQDTFAAGRVFSDVPILIIHGTDDTTVPYSNSVTVVNEAKKRNLKTTFWSVEGQPHAFIVAGINKQQYRNQVINFVNEVTKNPIDSSQLPSNNGDSSNTVIAITSKVEELFNGMLDIIRQIFPKR